MYEVRWISGPESPARTPTLGIYETQEAAEMFAAQCSTDGETVEILPVSETTNRPWFGW